MNEHANPSCPPTPQPGSVATPFVRYRNWPPIGDSAPAWVIDRDDLRVEQLDGLHQSLVSGALPAAAALVGAELPGLGLFADSALPNCAVRVARDRMLLVGPQPLNAEPGWHEPGFALSSVDNGLQAYALSGASVTALLRAGTAIDPCASSPCASLLFGGFTAIAYRCQGLLRLHVERSLAHAFEAWLRQAASDLVHDAPEPSP
jgi:hypothetical protein